MNASSQPSYATDWLWHRTASILVGLSALAIVCLVVLPSSAFDAVYGHSTLVLPPFTFAAALRAGYRRRNTAATNGWWFVLLGLAGFMAYEVLWYVAWVSDRTLTGPWADFSNLFFAPLVLVGILRSVPVHDTAAQRRRRYFDAAILACGAGAVIHTLVTLSGGGFRHVLNTRDFVILLQLPCDIATICGLAVLWGRRDSGVLPAWASSLGVAIVFGFAADIWYALPASVGNESPWFVRVAWYATWSALALGATRASTADVVQPRPGEISRLPYVLVAACFAALAIAVGLDHRAAIVSATIGIGVVTTLVLVRQVLTLNDVTAMQEERARSASDARLAALVRHSSDMLTIVNERFEVVYASPSHEWVVGVEPDAMLGVDLLSHIHRDDQPHAARSFSQLVSGESARESMVIRLRNNQGEWRWIEAVGSNLLAEPTIGGLVLNSRDITERKKLEDQLVELALRDPLTGLGNRRLFGDRVAHALERQQRSPLSVAVMLLDLDHFKFVNDTLGHAKGDALLVAVADRVRRAVRSGDTVARLGGDEFAVLLEDLLNEGEAHATAQRILAAVSAPFLLDNREVFVQCSIGIAWATPEQSVDDLVTDADVAMYAAKSAGRSRIEHFSTAMRASVAERHDVEAALHGALEREELHLVYQPIVDLDTGQISGAEALIRWHHRELGVLLPSRFIPIAEESDLIVQIGRQMLRKAAVDAECFRRARLDSPKLRVAVNLSARQLLSETLVVDVAGALRDAGIPGSALTVELTESVLASHEDAIIQRLHDLRALGVRIALDDFGTGYSSLAYLRRYPIDILKVDRSFVSWNSSESANDGVARAVVSIGQSLAMRTVAEGIETLEQLERMRTLGCSLGQGFLFARPLKRDDFMELLEGWDPRPFAAHSPRERFVTPTGR
jgi:diguanylate cyclase (GGDEF)-like protein/PAS domain S-box-containing protein